jgi:hypothetical protein
MKCKKRRLCKILSGAVLRYCCAGNVKAILDHTESLNEQRVIKGYAFYIENLGEDLGRLVEEYIMDRLSNGPDRDSL